MEPHYGMNGLASVPPLAAAPARPLVVTHRQGIALDWSEPSQPVWDQGVTHSFATAEILAVPDSSRLDDGRGRTMWQHMHKVSASLLSAAACMPLIDSVELRYVVEPQIAGPSIIRMFISAKTKSGLPALAASAVETACSTLPLGFTWSGAPTDLGLGGSGGGSNILELRREEEVIDPHWEYVVEEHGCQFFYLIDDRPGDGSGWPGFWEFLAAQRSPVEISFLFAATELHPVERYTIAQMTSMFELIGHPHTDFDVIGNQIQYPADMGARRALESWQERELHLQRPLLARVAVRADLAVGPGVCSALASAIAASEEPHHPRLAMWPQAPSNARDDRQARHSFDFMEILPWGGSDLWEHPAAPNPLRRMRYLYGLDHASGLALLPVPGPNGAPGFRRARRADGRAAAVGIRSGNADSVRLGEVLHHGRASGPAEIPLSSINRHVLVVGSPGSGKTTTVMTLLADLWTRHQIPFLVIESVKSEYRTLMHTPGMDDLQIFTLGREDLSPLRLNPLQPPPGVRCEVHIGALMAVLKMAMPLTPPLPELLGQAVDAAYRYAGWYDETTVADGIPAPSLRDLLKRFNEVFLAQGYRGDAANVGPAMRVRLTSLMRGSRGKTFDTLESVDFGELLAKPTVIEMDEIQDNVDRAVMAAFMLDRVRAGARARRSSGGRLRHVTVIEEAHRLLGKADLASGGSADGDSARADSVAAFCDAITELRSYGEGFVLSSQSPASLADAAVSNTGTRLIHRLESAADRDRMLADIGAGSADAELAARLRQGEALARWPEIDEPEVLSVEPGAGISSGSPVSDEAVADRMGATARAARALLPHGLCTREICFLGCSGSVRREGEDLARVLSSGASAAWQSSAVHDRARVEAVVDVVAPESRNRQICYCTSVHLAATGVALDLPARRPVGALLVDVVRRKRGLSDA